MRAGAVLGYYRYSGGSIRVFDARATAVDARCVKARHP
jgi:hypothetical protein